MISRVAENAFWLTRYLDRVESMARLLYVNTNFVLDVQLEDTPRWHPLVVVAGEEKRFMGSVPKKAKDDGETVQRFLTWEPSNPSSIAASLGAARENARTIRETISLEMWETLNGLWLWFNSKEAERRYQQERFEFYREVRNQCVLFQGFALDTMLQSEAYNFMRLGSSLERAGQTARILDVKYHAMGPTGNHIEMPSEVAQWQAILRSCAAIEPYFKVAHGELSGREVAEFLLFDRHFPRSVRRSLDRAWNFLQLIRPRGKTPIGKSSAEALRGLRAELNALTMEEIMAHGLHDKLTWFVDSVIEVCDAVQLDYFQSPLQIKRPRSAQRTKRAEAL